MSHNTTGQCPPEEGSGDTQGIKVLSAKEALRRDLKTLEVPAGADVMFSPYEPEFADYFAQVEVKIFDDLKTLGFVPRGLKEESVRRAIADDDEEAYKIAQTRLYNSPSGHGCECQPQKSSGPVSKLREQYASARQSFNPALARVLSDHLKTRIEWDNPIAGIVHKWVRHIEFAERAVNVAILNDITINRGATLRVDASTRSLLAGSIYIHQTGRLIFNGGYLKIWAHAISRLRTFAISTTALEDIPWRSLTS